MTPAIVILLVVLAIKGLVLVVPALHIVGIVLGWPLAIFLALTVLVDLFKNIPSMLVATASDAPGAKAPVKEIVEGVFGDVRRNYVVVMSISLVLRILTVFLLGKWFLFQ